MRLNTLQAIMPGRGKLIMLEWPGRCSRCGKDIEDWAEAGLHKQSWIHKSCFADVLSDASTEGQRLPSLRSPLDRSSQLELPMFFFLLLFHFGLGMGVIGWVLLTQENPTHSKDTGAILLALGLITPLIGVVGIATNIASRRRIEAVRRALDLQGGWKPGR